MKKIYFLFFFIIVFYTSNSIAQFKWQQSYLNGNNICGYIDNTGIFNQNRTPNINAGLIWPCGSNITYDYSTGLSAACVIDNVLTMFACSYNGELYPGYVNNLTGVKNSDFKIYSIKIHDNAANNPDYANWYKMVPYGAPYTDVNNNCMFDIGIDKPGIPEAAQTIFVCLTDAFPERRLMGEGFGGGVVSPLLFAELHFTVWVYTIPQLYDVQFMRYEIINKGNKNWEKLHFGLFDDPDIGFSSGNYFGCDTTNNLGFVYDSDTVITSGAYGISVLRGLINKTTGETMNFSSFVPLIEYYPCEGIAQDSGEAFFTMSGLKLDGSSNYDPTKNPPVVTKCIFTGDPETGTGWVPSKGYLTGCNGINYLIQLPRMDVKFVLGLGADNFSMAPGDTQKIYLAQMIASGNSNLNSVTKLKNLAERVKLIFNAEIYDQIKNNYGILSGVPFPSDYYLSQNFPNPFNITTKFQYGIPRVSDVKLEVFDVTGKKVVTLINGEIQPGRYELNWNAAGIASGVYLYRMEVVDKTASLLKRYSNIKKLVLIK